MKHTTRRASLIGLGAITAVAMVACGAPGTADTGTGPDSAGTGARPDAAVTCAGPDAADAGSDAAGTEPRPDAQPRTRHRLLSPPRHPPGR